MASSPQSRKSKAKTRAKGLPRHGNRSIVVAVSLLRVIASLGRPATLSEIASAAGMSAPRSHRYLLGLTNTRLVEHNPVSGLYDLGSELVQLGVAALGKVDAVRFASEALIPLAEETGLAALITMWGTNGPTVIRCEQAQLVSAVRTREGRNLSVLHSASGRIFLTYLPEATTAPFVQRELAAPAKGHAITLKDIETMRAEVRKLGVARGLGEETPNIGAVAAPVFALNGRLALSIALIGAITGFDTNAKGKPALALKRTAEELSRRLGYAPDEP
ncbi:MAG TPA: IclR family transcriptional regulator [Xanthobacteraceae bacterium]|nr:IclR family transcriptional regulator [Xanthobacteraceae bacterium]